MFLGGYLLEALDVAKKAVEVASDKQAKDIVLLDIRKVCPYAEYFVILSGTSDRQLKMLSDEISTELKKAGARVLQREGEVESGWILLDFGDVIVHIFSPEERDYYHLERLWSDAIPVVRMQ